jgi:hypothetical protein
MKTILTHGALRYIECWTVHKWKSRVEINEFIRLDELIFDLVDICKNDKTQE